MIGTAWVLLAIAPLAYCQDADADRMPMAIADGPCARPAWPNDAVQTGTYGTLTLGILVSTEGDVEKARILVGTPSSELNSKGLAAVAHCSFYFPRTLAKPTWMRFSFTWPQSELSAQRNRKASLTWSQCEYPKYPRESLRYEQTGDVKMAFLIDVEGNVVEKKVSVSSGFALLDEAALKAIGACKFSPGLKDGTPEESWTEVLYRWTIGE